VKRLLIVAFALLPALVGADDSPFSSRAIVAYRLALTDLGRFGAPRYTTALLPPCTMGNRGAMAFDTTAGALKTCSGSTWASGGGLSFGGPSGGTATRIPFTDGSGNLSDDADLTFSIDTLTATKIGSTIFIGSNTFTGANEFSGKTNISGLGSGTNVEIGSTSNDANAGTGGTSVCIGNSCSNTANAADAVVIGSLATAITNPLRTVVIGATASTGGPDNVVIGHNAVTTFGAYDNVVIGSSTVINNVAGNVLIGKNGTSGNNNCIGLGQDVTCDDNSAFIVGALNHPYTEGYFGEGRLRTTPPTLVRFQATGGTGTNIAGSTFAVAGGRGTGSGRGGNLDIHTSPSLTTGTTLQTPEVRAKYVAQQFTLVDNTVATFATLTLGDDSGGGGTIHYCIKAKDATNEQMECGTVEFTGVDITAGAGGETCTAPSKVGTPSQALSSGTLTTTFAATTGTDLCNLRVTADTSLTPTTLWIKYSVIHNSGQTITPQ
jgi:hypothetical protein